MGVEDDNSEFVLYLTDIIVCIVQFPTSAFTVNRASFKINRFNVYSTLSDTSMNVEFIRSTYNMGKMTTMMNMVVQVAGYVSVFLSNIIY